MKIKLQRWLLLSSLFLMGAADAQQSNVIEKTQDFAYGQPLITESNAPFYRIELPEAVYLESVWPDLRDVRVFNNQGQAVPFALTANVTQQKNNQTFPLRLFPMNSQHKRNQDQNVVSLKSASGVELTLPLGNEQQVRMSYLLEIPQQAGKTPSLTQLTLSWQRLPENWQTRVMVLYSDDLKQWHTGIEDAPLMDLVAGNDRMLLNTIDLDDLGRYYSPRYLLLLFKDAKTALNLNIESAQGIVASSHTEQQRVSLPFSQQAISASEALYTWANPQPLDNITIRPAQDNTVLPLEVEYRSGEHDSWQPLAKQVVFFVNGRSSEAISLNGLLVQGIRLKGINQQWGDQLPQLRAERNSQTLVFNAQGTPPFLLAWGSKAAQPQAISLDTLIPAALRETVSANALPDAGFQTRVVLGGAERLSAMGAAQEVSMWKQSLLWVLLVLGAGALVLLALKLWKEVQHKAE